MYAPPPKRDIQNKRYLFLFPREARSNKGKTQGCILCNSLLFQSVSLVTLIDVCQVYYMLYNIYFYVSIIWTGFVEYNRRAFGVTTRWTSRVLAFTKGSDFPMTSEHFKFLVDSTRISTFPGMRGAKERNRQTA